MSCRSYPNGTKSCKIIVIICITMYTFCSSTISWHAMCIIIEIYTTKCIEFMEEFPLPRNYVEILPCIREYQFGLPVVLALK